MSRILDFIFGSSDDDRLEHYGMPRRSGRYPWGSGDNPYQHDDFFLGRVRELRAKGISEKEIAAEMGLSTTQLRVQYSLAKDEERKVKVATAKALRDKGYSLDKIAAEMGYKNDSSIRSLLNEHSEARMNAARATADFLKKQVDEKGMIEVGRGTELNSNIGVSREKLNEALYILELQGYPTYGGGVPQVTNKGKQTILKVLCPPGTEHKEIYNFENIHSIDDYISHDGGETFDPTWVYPKSMDSKRLKINYSDDGSGGGEKDGLIEIRRGVDDLSLGESHYAQVRILVDNTHYIKGMAIYSDNMPPGVDVMFNTNKTKDKPMKEVLKPIKNDPENPFGSLIKAGVVDPDNPAKREGGQSYYIDKNGKKQLSLINKRAEEGDWGAWADHLPSQFLSKQKQELIDRQLSMTTKDKKAEFDEIMSLTNPTVKKAMLKTFAEDCDSAAEHLQAAALPRQKYQVIFPMPSMKDTEVYAPNYENGEKVALIRYPHGGTFEIPILTVNNKQPDAKNVLGNAKDAVGINSNVASRLSGADFDGDTVMVIPTGGKTKITSTPALEGLKGFDPKLEYGGREEGTFKVMKDTQKQMGVISNLITDMTLKGAKTDELARAVRHSMVVIDAEKHKLDYKQSELDNGIKDLKRKYQGHIGEDDRYHEGAATVISRAKSEQTVLRRRGQPWINPDTGALEWERINPKTGKFESKIVTDTWTDKKGKEHQHLQKSTKMAEAKSAFDLVSDYEAPAEIAYARYANTMKTMANSARKEMLNTGKIETSASARKTYAAEVSSLMASLNVALANAPRERRAQIMANADIAAKKKANPDLYHKKSELKKLEQQALTRARNAVGAKRTTIHISDREWEAIQAGAISESKLYQIINHTDSDELRKRATPRAANTLSTAKINQIKSMSDLGYTQAEIASRLSVSTSTVNKYL